MRHAAVTLLLALAVATDGVAGDSPRAIDAIEHDLVADDPGVRAKAAAELTDRFPDGAVAVPMLVDLLDDEDPAVVAAAAKAIDSIAVAAAQILLPFVVDDAKWTASRLSQNASFIDTNAWNALNSDDLATAALLPDDDGVTTATPELLWKARSGPAPERPLAAAALALHGQDAVTRRDFVPSVNALRTSAASELAAIARRDDDVRACMAELLIARLRPSDPDVISVLSQNLTSVRQPRPGEEPIAARGACRALASIGPPAAGATAALAAAIRNPASDRALVRGCSRALIRIGNEAALQDLMDADPQNEWGLANELAVERRAAKRVVPYFTRLLQQAKEPRFDAMAGLAEFGTDGASALPVLNERAAKTTDPFLQLAYANPILAIDPQDADALRVIADPRKFPDRLVERAIGLRVLRLPASAAFVDELRKLLTSPPKGAPPNFEAGVIDAVARCGPVSARVLPDLVRLIDAADAACREPGGGRASACPRRRRLAVTLGRIGPDAAAAIPALTALRDKGDETIRVSAAQALRRIKAKK